MRACAYKNRYLEIFFPRDKTLKDGFKTALVLKELNHARRKPR